MKIGDMLEIYYITDSGHRVNLLGGIIVGMDHYENRDLITVLTSDGEIKEYSRNIPAIRFDVINELSDAQLEMVRGGMDSSFYGIWRSSVLNESW